MNKKIKNERYRQFLDNGLIEFLEEENLEEALNRVKGKNIKEGRALIIAMYFTGARPIEILNIKSKDITKDKSYVKIKVPASKNGLPRTLFFSYKNKHIRELYDFAITIFDEMFCFYNFRSHYKREVITKNGIKERIEITDSLRYHFNKWFNGDINPYFLRHNRFSKLIEAGCTAREVQFMKGSKTMASVEPYLHMSTSMAKKISRKIK